MVNSIQPSNLSALKTEIAHFREELNMRDQLVQQLSQELFRIVKSNHPEPGELVGDHRGEIRALREQLQGVETQVHYYQDQLQNRDSEIQQLRRTVRELSDRSRMLEQVVQELPKIYTQKFAERLAPIREKIASRIAAGSRECRCATGSFRIRPARYFAGGEYDACFWFLGCLFRLFISR
jgi:chromosome segregation ATPase